jgi:hypothetical protein
MEKKINQKIENAFYLGLVPFALISAIVCRCSFNLEVIIATAIATIALTVICALFDVYFFVKEKDVRHLVTAILFFMGALTHLWTLLTI